MINKALEGELATTDKLVETAPIDGGESSKVLSKYIAEIIEKGLDNVRDSGGALADQVELVNKIVATIMTETKEAEFDSMAVAKRAEQLLALFDKKDNAFALNESRNRSPGNFNCAKLAVYGSHSRTADVYRAEKGDRLGRSY